ncbi:hypothetical protein Ahy_B03g064424 [Arachis hypogaea]|uniref:CCHC-type domain-containing protein n=1 Tax=Arachis hypogaea TaxID=3818 RepID=A0A444ZZJ3_ARAHY|nr:hypothetical protein Ahy_B03g064424 [Arachis hypogaea]
MGGVLNAHLYIRQSFVPFSFRRRVCFEWSLSVGSVIEGTANLVVYCNGEIIRNTHEEVRFVSQNPFSFVVSYTMMLMELQNGLCQSMENEAEGIQNDLDIEDDRAAVYEGMNSDSEEDFEATYEAGDEDEDGDVGVEAAVENVVVHPSSSQLMNVPPFIRDLDLDAMHAPEFLEYANIGVANPEEGEFRIGMKYSFRKSVVAAIRSYTISRGVDYNVYESEPQINFLREFKVPHLQKLVVNIGYSRTVEEYNINYKRLEERGEAYAKWCDAIGLRHWVLAFDEGHRWGHITRNLVESINLVLKGARNLPVLALVRAIYYRLNELFTRKSAETHERKHAGFTYSVFAQQRIEANMQQTGNIVVHRFDRRNEANVKWSPQIDRYLNEMDSRDMRGPRICRLCGAQGHSRSRCPQRPGPSGAGDDAST